ELERLQREVPVVENLQRAFPGAHAQMENGHVSRLFGTVLGSGATPDQAADSFRDAMITAHRAAAGDVRPVRQGRNERGTFEFVAKSEPIGLMFDAATAQYGFFLYRYAQQVTGIPVFDAELLVLVKNEPGNPVVWANNSLRNIAAFTPPRAPRALGVDGAKSLAAVQAHVLARSPAEPTPQSLDRFDPPELVIFAGAGDQDAAPRLAMAYLAESAGGLGKFRLIADASTGDILNVESLTLSLNVPGDVRGNATNSHTSAECGAETSQPMPYAEVGISGGSAGFSSQAGFFLLPNPGTTPVNVNSTLQGNYFDISNLQGANVSLTQSVTPPNQVHFLHNAADNQEFVIAQANAYFHVNKVRDFLLGYIPTYPTISTQTNFSILVNGDGTNSPGLCPGNAWYQGTNLLFCVRSSSQPNTAYGTVVDHEFGHHIVSSGGSGQGEYGEGMGDAIAALVTEQPRLGAGWDVNNCDSNLRTADNDCQFDAVNCSSCGSEIHDCGNLISGVIWDLRQQLMISNPSNFRDLVNALTLNSIPLHTGTGIGPSIAIDFLTLDDNDGNIANGTPHGAQICAAFAAHGISCPLAPSTPCGGICSNPVVFSWTGSYQSGALGTGAVCRETTHPVAGGNCGNFSGGRTLSVNGTVMPCNNQNWSFLPPARNGGYCVSTTPGNQPWAFFTLF
ncbi:MAG TPA: hypothetical protein VG963_02535, partial [Polyangiaceae bacterium]|nr:hypothetical protein [Polyangiaceae bacterium]